MSGANTIFLRYLGSSHVLEDPQTGLTWRAGDDVHEVSAEDATRLKRLPHDMFEVLSAEEAKAIADAKKEAEAQRRQEEIRARERAARRTNKTQEG